MIYSEKSKNMKHTKEGWDFLKFDAFFSFTYNNIHSLESGMFTLIFQKKSQLS